MRAKAWRNSGAGCGEIVEEQTENVLSDSSSGADTDDSRERVVRSSSLLGEEERIVVTGLMDKLDYLKAVSRHHHHDSIFIDVDATPSRYQMVWNLCDCDNLAASSCHSSLALMRETTTP